jgi:hypothetical protein
MRYRAKFFSAGAWEHDDPGASDNLDVKASAIYDSGDSVGYKQVVGQADNQTWKLYHIIIVPYHFGKWKSGTVFKLTYKVSDGSGNTGVVLKIYDTGGTLRKTTSKGQSTTKADITISDTDLSAGTFAVEGEFRVLVEVTVDNADTAYIGSLKMYYDCIEED